LKRAGPWLGRCGPRKPEKRAPEGGLNGFLLTIILVQFLGCYVIKI
jgi:hypothetical protein